MLELASLSTFLDIFQRTFGLIEKRKDQKRKLFEEIIEPIYTQLSVVVNDYYAFFRSFRDELSQSEMRKWATVLDERKKKREEIVLARNKVLGLTDAFTSAHYKSKAKEDVLLCKFVRAIHLFFYASDDLGHTEASSLFFYIDRVIRESELKGEATPKDWVITHVEYVLQDLEWQWREISAAYGELRIVCLA